VPPYYTFALSCFFGKVRIQKTCAAKARKREGRREEFKFNSLSSSRLPSRFRDFAAHSVFGCGETRAESPCLISLFGCGQAALSLRGESS
jgi:hypothetical protein